MRICIEVSGAMVQNVYAIGNDDVPVDVIVCDFDLSEYATGEDEAEYEEMCREFDAFRADPGCSRVW